MKEWENIGKREYASSLFLKNTSAPEFSGRDDKNWMEAILLKTVLPKRFRILPVVWQYHSLCRIRSCRLRFR